MYLENDLISISIFQVSLRPIAPQNIIIDTTTTCSFLIRGGSSCSQNYQEKNRDLSVDSKLQISHPELEFWRKTKKKVMNILRTKKKISKKMKKKRKVVNCLRSTLKDSILQYCIPVRVSDNSRSFKKYSEDFSASNLPIYI